MVRHGGSATYGRAGDTRGNWSQAVLYVLVGLGLVFGLGLCVELELGS